MKRAISEYKHHRQAILLSNLNKPMLNYMEGRLDAAVMLLDMLDELMGNEDNTHTRVAQEINDKYGL